MIPIFTISQLRKKLSKKAQAQRLANLRSVSRILKPTPVIMQNEDIQTNDLFHIIMYKEYYTHKLTRPNAADIFDPNTNWNQEDWIDVIDDFDPSEEGWKIDSSHEYTLVDDSLNPGLPQALEYIKAEKIAPYWVRIPNVYNLTELANLLGAEIKKHPGWINTPPYPVIDGYSILMDEDDVPWQVNYRISREPDASRDFLVGRRILVEDQPGSINKQPTFVVRSVEDGIDVMNHPDIVKNWKKSLRIKPKHSRAVLIPCAATKPFPEAPSHKHGYLKALQNKGVDIYVVSEPLGIIPYKWSRTYPNDDYDFPPKYVKGDGRDLLVSRFKGWYDKVGKKYDKIYLALPGHHMGLVLQAGIEGVDASISNCRDNTCSDDAFRATTQEYIDFLRRKVR